jgi:hypothetical protein
MAIDIRHDNDATSSSKHRRHHPAPRRTPRPVKKFLHDLRCFGFGTKRTIGLALEPVHHGQDRLLYGVDGLLLVFAPTARDRALQSKILGPTRHLFGRGSTRKIRHTPYATITMAESKREDDERVITAGARSSFQHRESPTTSSSGPTVMGCQQRQW